MRRSLERALLYARTARHLRWEQWVYRPIRRLQRYLLPPSAAGAVADPGRSAALAGAVAGWGMDGESAALRRADEVLAGTFRFLNHAEALPRIEWGRRYVSHLWSYNLHYFDYAVDLAWAYRITGDRRYAGRFGSLAESWIRRNAPARGDGWEPYPVSLRVVNWIYAVLLCGDGLGEESRSRIVASAAAQLAFLERRLELHILANHLQKNLKALVVGGAFFAGPAAERWLREGTGLLWRELFEQVLADGGHYERSPMYHAIALADFLEVVSLMGAIGEPVPGEVRERVAKMVEAFGALCRPDGSLHLFNDSADGIAPCRPWLDALARATVGRGIPESEGAIQLPETGYYGFVIPASGARLLVDCGVPGPSYQPGHAHCDLLSFELDAAGQPLVVDSGVSGYDGDPLREYVRSTRGHNTVVVDGREQSEVWGTFRVARRAVVRGAEQRMDGEEYSFSGSYSPYHDRRIVHHRVIEYRHGALAVTDRVDRATNARLTSFLHLHPSLTVEQEGDAYLLLRATSPVARVEFSGIDRASVRTGEHSSAQGWYCPGFGMAVPAPVIEMHVDRNAGQTFGYSIRLLI